MLLAAGPQGQLDWMTGSWDERLATFVNELTGSSDTILLGRKMTEDFITYWENVINNQPDSHEFTFAQKMVTMKKIVFSKTQKTLENRDLVTSVNALKNQSGKDIIVYGGANFVSSLIDNNLIDELHLFINPIAIGEGLSIFTNRRPLQLANSTAYKNGIVVNKYIPVSNK
jgi:dihydrofolate reductase